MLTRLCIVRHGETDWNAAGRLQGHSDIPLNQRGRAQARAMAERLAGQSFVAVFSSDLARACETAAAAADRLGLEVETAPALRERFLGALQGLTHTEAQARYQADYARFRARDPDHLLPGGGESLRVFSARIAAALAALAESRPGGALLIVTHGGVLDVAHRLATGKGLHEKRNFSLLNAALNWVERRDGQWTLLSWGETAHLEGGALDEILDNAEKKRR